ncbi:LOW QUALITY PROTEIN: quattro [Gadus morhua]|uniref:LOW QUALITY PROTEIN: quattro n=1 Tax=Gadus morhua TaxID=8049 RepID=UPI0011B4A5B9|nr:LOW QUALITY PROTEIN: uncharacterized protein LOC115557317 [Gadus morhua]
MNPQSLDSSIQSALSALFPPFEATAPIVLSQLFRTIEERYHGDALQCLLDFLIPSKHILESVQQAACAAYSDVIFCHEGWPLCLHDQTVIHLAPLNPLLLRPSDFYLQVEPFGEQAARIVLKSLLAEGCREVEETPILETSYPCIFTEDWLRDINEGRHGTPLTRCLLSTDQGVIKLPWAKVAIPEFIEKPKPTVPSSLPLARDTPPEPRRLLTPSHYNSSTLPMESLLLPRRDRMRASLRIPEDSSKLVKVHNDRPAPKTCPKPSPKPIGWVSPNTWDCQNYREIEGDYVDLVDLVKDKEALAKLDNHPNPPGSISFKPVRPPPPVPVANGSGVGGRSLRYGEGAFPPCSQKRLSYEMSEQEMKCRYRDSYTAALKNPVAFERGSAELLAALKEFGFQSPEDFGPNGRFVTHGDHPGHSLNCCKDYEPHKEPQRRKACCQMPESIESHAKEPSGRLVAETLTKELQLDEKFASGGIPRQKVQTDILIPHQKGHGSKGQTKANDSPVEKCEDNIIPHHKAEVLKPPVKFKAKLRSLSTVSESPKGSPILYKLNNRSHSDICPEMIPSIIHYKQNAGFSLATQKEEVRHSPKKDLQSNNNTDGSYLKLHDVKTDKPLPSPREPQPSVCPAVPSAPQSQEATLRSIVGLLQLGTICLPGGRDKTGRAVLEVHGERAMWTAPLASAPHLCRLILYMSLIPRKEVRDLGMTLVIDARKRPPPPLLYKALLMAQEQALHAVHSILILVDKDTVPRPERQPGLQMDVVTSLKALNKIVEASQLTSDLGGTFAYSHTDWLQLHQRLVSFTTDLQGADSLLQKAIKKVDETKSMDTAQEVQQCIQEQRTSMKEVLENSRLVSLQREGGAILARFRREDLRFQQSEDSRDAVEAVTSLYNQLEEKLHTLVMRSNESLQHLQHLFRLREVEGHINAAGIWFNREGEATLKDNSTLDTLKDSETALQHLDAFLTQAMEKKQVALALMLEAQNIVDTSPPSPATDVFRTVVSTFKSNMDDLLHRAEPKRKELDVLTQLHRFCEQASAMAEECVPYLEQVEGECYLTEATQSTLNKYEERFSADLSSPHFQAVKTQALGLGPRASGVLRAWNAAWVQCQKVRQRLGESGKMKCVPDNQNQAVPAAASQGELGVQERKEEERKGEEEEAEDVEKRRKSAEAGGLLTRGSPASSTEVNNADGDQGREKKKKKKSCEGEPGGKACAAQWPGPQSTPDPCPGLPGAAVKDEVVTGAVSRLSGASPGCHVANRRRQKEHHSDMDLRRVDSFGQGEESPSHQGLGRSLSEGSCVNPSLTSFPSPPSPFDAGINVQMRRQTLGPSVLPVHTSTSISSHHSFCLGDLRVESDSEGKGGRGCSPPKTDPMVAPRNPLEPSGRTESLTGPTAEQITNKLLKLRKILEELLCTEREYVRALGYVGEHYFPELERADVPQDLRGQRGVIFGNLEKLHDFHRHTFLKELEGCAENPLRVGRCFLRHRENFALYALYSKNKPRSDALLVHRGQDFFKQKQLELGDKMDLWSYLLKPVQRISKYSLLLHDVALECGPGHARERAELSAALEVIHFQLRHGNDLLAMDDIHSCDVNLKEQGQLIRQDEFLVTFRKKKCFRHVFLFRDLLLFSKTKKTGVGNDVYIYKQSFKTSDLGMTHNSGCSGLCFEIWFRRRKSQDTYTLQATCREVKEAWTKDLTRILWEQALHNRELRMQESVFMGIGNKRFMDIQPSDAAIKDRAINYVRMGREIKEVASASQSGSRDGLPFVRPESFGSERSLCSSSSSSIGSLSPAGYLGGSKQSRLEGPSGALKEGDLDHNMDSSESSGDSVSVLSQSTHSIRSAGGRETQDTRVKQVTLEEESMAAPDVPSPNIPSGVPEKTHALPSPPSPPKPPLVAPKPKTLYQPNHLACGKVQSAVVGKSTEV